MRAALGVLAAAAALAVALPTAGGHQPPLPARPCPGATDAVQTSGAWTVIRKPAQLDRITTHAAGGRDGVNVLASDGSTVMRSADGGCTWAQSYDIETSGLPGAGSDAADATLPTVHALTFPNGGARAFMLVDGVGRASASRLFVSDDAGKTWTGSGSGLPPAGGFRDLVAAPSDGKVLYLTVGLNDAAGDNDPSGTTPLPPDSPLPPPDSSGTAPGVSGLLYASADGGASWNQASTGAQIERLAVDPLAPQKLWAVRATHKVERSDDGGRNWAAVNVRTPPDDDAAQPEPLDSSWRDVAVAHNDGLPATVVLAASPDRISDASRVVASVDGGHLFIELPTDSLGPIAGLTFGNSAAQLLFVAGSDSTAFHGPGLSAFDLGQQSWRDVDALELNSLREPRPVPLDPATRGHDGLRAIELRRDQAASDPPAPDAIVRYTPPDPPPGQPGLTGIKRCGTATPGGPLRASTRHHTEVGGDEVVKFDPSTLALGLAPGVPQRLALKADVGAVPTPLDVYFLIDRSNSMDPAIEGVLCSARRLARELGEKRIDAWFGVGAYNDRNDYRYTRFLDISPPDLLSDALKKVLTLRGNEEPIRSGLYQTATGAGLEFRDSQGHAFVAPHQQANYRDGALHTVIVIGDEPYEDTTPAEPSREEVVAALKKKGILAIGVQVVPPRFDPPTADPGRIIARQLILRQQLDYFAQQSGALAPAGGVDCDGGGTPDLQTGDPLVCQVGELGIQESMGDTLVSVLRNLRDVADLKLVPVHSGGLSISVEGGALPGANIKQHNALAGTAVVSCTLEQAGKTYRIAFGVLAGNRIVGTLSGTARCGNLVPAAAAPHKRSSPPAKADRQPVAPAAVPSTPPSATPHPAIVPPPPPPPPAPAPVSPLPAQAPASAPVSAPASAPALAPAQPAVAPEPQRSPVAQAALIRTDPQSPASEHALAPRDPRAGEHFLTARSHGRSAVPVPAIVTFGIGLAGALGWGAVLAGQARSRRRVAPVRVYTRR